MQVTKTDAKKLIGQHIYALKKDGAVVSGKLLSIKGSTLMLQHQKGKNVRIKAIIPLVLFDLLAIGTAPYAYGAYGGYPGFGYGPGGFGGGFGYPGGFFL